MNATMPSVRFNATPQTAASPVFHSRAKRGFGPKRNSQQTAWMFHKIDYATFACSRKVEVSCFCKVGMSLSPGLMAVEIADGTDSDERARPAADR
ncbi:hypothetical protein, partial [Rhizobium ruizarguesonis]|uniref:hypothetical protein n=1 Tax=Rhizobium ruizarguesonis TaxID=2081791 RepID=UPI001952C512